MQIHTIPVLKDNYTYLIVDEVTSKAVVVDPAEAAPVLDLVSHLDVQLTHIMLTHHHWDHVGGVPALLAHSPELYVMAGREEAPRIAGVTDVVIDGDIVRIGFLEGRTMCVPCHTRGHVAFVFEDALFCGDTLFIGGCGRFFEGDAGQMHEALNVRFASLAPDTRVFCAHEYTVSNLTFALHVEPENVAAQAKMAWATERRSTAQPTVPSTLAQERTYNPFMRVDEPAVQRFSGSDDAVEVMRVLRQAKDGFRG